MYDAYVCKIYTKIRINLIIFKLFLSQHQIQKRGISVINNRIFYTNN